MTRPFNPRLRIRSDTLGALAVALAPVLYFLPSLLSGSVLCPDDGTLFNTPIRVVAARIVLGGSLPFWNPYIFSGMPLFASAQGGLLFPLNWFYLAFPPVTATNLMVVSTYAIAGLGAYLYSRRSGASIAGSLMTSIAWQLGGFAIGQIGHINIVQTGACLPWILWSLDGFGEGRGRKWAVFLSTFVALQAFVGHQQTFAYSVILVSSYAIVMRFTGNRSRKLYLWSLVFIAAGVLLAAVQIVPTFELLRNSMRAEATYDFITSFSLPRRMVETFLAPYIFGGGDGRLFRAPYVGAPFYGELAGYVGVISLMLAIIGVISKPDSRTKFWAAAALACLVLALGRYAPLQFYRVIYHVPILNLFRVPARNLMVVEFALAVLAGRGFTSVARMRGETRAVRRAYIVGAGVVIVTCLAVTVGRPSDFKLGRLAPVSFMRAPELFVPVIVACVSAWVLWMFARSRTGGATVAVIAILALDLVVWGQSSGWRLSSPNSRDEMFQTPETVKLLRQAGAKDPASYRILTAPHTFDPAISPLPPSVTHSTDWILWTQPDLYMMSGVPNAAGYDGFGLARYSRLAGDMKVWGELTDPDSTLRGDSPAMDILNVRYLLSMRRTSDSLADISPELRPAIVNLGGALFDATDLGLPDVGAGKRLTFSVPPIQVDHVALLTNLAWSDRVPDGTTVAQVRLRANDGRFFDFPLRAGADTAEWSHDRPDLNSRIKHKRATVGISYAVTDAVASYEGHAYVATIVLPQNVTLTGGEIVVQGSDKWPNLLLSVFRLSLTNGDKSYALRRELVSVETIGAPGDASSNRWRFLAHTTYVDIYQNEHALPRVWLATNTRTLPAQATLDVINSGRLPDGSEWEPRKTALLESEPTLPLAGGTQSAAEIVKYEPNRVDIRTNADSRSVLVLSENHYPGWRAYVDGRSVDVLRVDYNLRGVLLDAGSHQVTFIYRPKSVLIGLLATLASAMLIGLWFFRLLPEERAVRVLARFVRARRNADAVLPEEI
ncbi:MAG: YfhO family protein [Pyrinomonadaceae bacterium]